MKCKYNDVMEFHIITPENASFILDKLGFGESKCAETFNKDGRYGRVVENGIEYGFAGRVGISGASAKASFGDYFVDDAYDGWSIMSENGFFQMYDVVEE